MKNLKSIPFTTEITYRDGKIVRSLVGTKLFLQKSNQAITVVIDLSSNLKVKNKNMKCFQDAADLIKKSAELKTIKLGANDFARKIEREYEFYENHEWLMQLKQGTDENLNYSICLKISENTAYLNVREYMGKSFG